MTTSDTNTDTAMRNTTTTWYSSAHRLARSVKTSASNGNIRPSKTRAPNQIESFGWSRPNHRLTPQARPTQIASAASSIQTLCACI